MICTPSRDFPSVSFLESRGFCCRKLVLWIRVICNHGDLLYACLKTLNKLNTFHIKKKPLCEILLIFLLIHALWIFCQILWKRLYAIHNRYKYVYIYIYLFKSPVLCIERMLGLRKLMKIERIRPTSLQFSRLEVPRIKRIRSKETYTDTQCILSKYIQWKNDLAKVGQSFRIVTRRTNSRSSNINSPAYRHYYYYLSPREARPLPNAINRAL